MKKSFASVSLPVLSFVLLGCQERVLSYRMEGRDCSEPDCAAALSDNGGMCASVNLLYPVFLAPEAAAVRANGTVDSLLFAHAGGADSLCAEFFRHWEKFRSDNSGDTLAQEDGDDERIVLPWYYAASLEVKGRYKGLLSLVYTVATNARYDMEVFPQKYFVLDEKTGRRLSVAEVFSDTLALRRATTAFFFDKAGISPEMSLLEQGVSLSADGLLPLTNDFAVGQDGETVFRYDMDAIAPALFPEDEIAVPGEVLKPLFKSR